MEGDQETLQISKSYQTDTLLSEASACCRCKSISVSKKQDDATNTDEEHIQHTEVLSEDSKDLKSSICHESSDEETCTCLCIESEQSESSKNPIVDNDFESTRDGSSQSLRKSFPHQCKVRAIDEKKNKLRTSKDVYDRLKWDFDSILISTPKGQQETLDLASVYVGYKDRFLGMCELSYEEFQPGGDIPFHRIYYFRTGGPPIEPFIGKDGEVKVRHDNLPAMAVFIWDRDSRTDLVFKSGNSTFLKKV